MFAKERPLLVPLCALCVYLGPRAVSSQQGSMHAFTRFSLYLPKYMYIHAWCAHQFLQAVQLQAVQLQAVGAAGSGTWPQSADAGAFWTGGGSTDKAAGQVRDLQVRVVALEEENAELQADAARHEAQLSVLKEELRAVDRAEKRAETSANAQVRSVFRRKFCFLCWSIFQAS